MIEHWQKSYVIGTGDDFQATEIVLHKRGQDPMNLAMRRNPALPASSRVEVRTYEVFTMIREDERWRIAEDIPRDDRQGEEVDR